VAKAKNIPKQKQKFRDIVLVVGKTVNSEKCSKADKQ